jgi:Domain of unknown function (DUF4926)
MIREHDRVVLTVPISDHGLEPGDVGVIVHIYPRHEAYEVEFVTLAGQTAAIVTGGEEGQVEIIPSSKRIILTLFEFVVLSSPPSSCVSHGSKPTVKGITTAFPGWSRAALFSRSPVMVRSRRNDSLSSCAA